MSVHGPKKVSIAQFSIGPTSGWRRLPAVAGTIGVLGIVASFFLGRSAPEQFYYSWLVSFLFFLSLSLGGLFFVLFHHATKAGWGVVVRRLAESVMALLPIMILLFIPIYLGITDLYHWSEPEVMAHDELLQQKKAYLNKGFFSVRALIFFASWTLLALFFWRTSRRQDETGEQRLSSKMIFWAGPGLFLFAATITFAAFDWIMSLDPHWYSTMYGVYFFAGCVVSIFALLSVMAILLQRSGYLGDVVTFEHYHDLGKLLFAFTVFWSYIAFSQFFLIWYANIPEETIWFIDRMEGSWSTVTRFLAFGHFAIPFFFLMPRTIKRKRPLLLLGALWMLMIHFVDLYWQVMPTLHHEGVQLTLLDATTFLGIGGIFFAVVGWLLCRGPLVPVKDPRLLESLAFENF